MSFIPGTTSTFPDGLVGSQLANVQTIATTLMLTSASRRKHIFKTSALTSRILALETP